MTMPDPPSSDDSAQIQYSTGGGTVVTPQPNERAYPLRMEEFLTLCDGDETNTSAQWRNFCLAAFVTAAIGFAGLLATIDFAQVVAEKKLAPIVWTSVMALIMLLSGVLTAFFHSISRESEEAGAYKRLKRRIQDSLGGVEIKAGSGQSASGAKANVDEMKTTAGLASREGNLIRAQDRPEVYIVQNGQRHHIPDEGTLTARWSWDQVQVLTQEEVDAIPLGTPVSRGRR